MVATIKKPRLVRFGQLARSVCQYLVYSSIVRGNRICTLVALNKELQQVAEPSYPEQRLRDSRFVFCLRLVFVVVMLKSLDTHARLKLNDRLHNRRATKPKPPSIALVPSNHD